LIIGHQRLAEVCFAAGQLGQAHDAFLKCFHLSSSRAEKDQFMELMRACKRDQARQKAMDEKVKETVD
jgi:hypothetical protein